MVPANPSSYQSLTIDHEQVFLTCDTLRTAVSHLEARALIEEGRTSEARKKLKQLIDDDSAEALYLAAFLSDEEARRAVDEAHVSGIKKASDLGYPPAVYRYGVYLDTGEFGEENRAEAAKLFKRAADSGHARSEWIHGTALLYGNSIYTKDVEKGLEFIRRSADRLFVEALETLARFYEAGEFGFPVDASEASACRNRKSDANSIEE